MLADDEEMSVRREVAVNSNTPEDILRRLADDGDEYVAASVAANPTAPEDILRMFLKSQVGTDEYTWARDNLRERGLL